jgi:hypothetical protein
MIDEIGRTIINTNTYRGWIDIIRGFENGMEKEGRQRAGCNRQRNTKEINTDVIQVQKRAGLLGLSMEKGRTDFREFMVQAADACDSGRRR